MASTATWAATNCGNTGLKEVEALQEKLESVKNAMSEQMNQLTDEMDKAQEDVATKNSRYGRGVYPPA